MQSGVVESLMAAEGTTFVSFRRIRYHLASLAYRDLMLSGALPWLSDHCIKTQDALRFVDDPHSLQPFLTDVIGQSEFALALVDPGYLDSPWTVLEFEHIVRKGLKAHVVLLDGAQAPRAWQQERSVQIHPSIGSALAAICGAMGKKLVSFAGQPLSSARLDHVSGYWFRRPSWITANPAAGNALSEFGDYVWFNMAPVRSEPGLQISRMVENGPHHGTSALYDLYEQELWHQVRRIAAVEGSSAQQIGYHKLEVPALRATAVALSLQLADSGGFCRYASLTVPGQSAKLELVCFVKGGLQRFHTLVPDIDRIVISLAPGGEGTTSLVDEPVGSGANQAPVEDFLWVRCAACKRRVLDMYASRCPHCEATQVECLTMHCTRRRRVAYADLWSEVSREREQARRWGYVSQGVYDLGALCDGCLSSLYIPGSIAAGLMKYPAHGTGVIWSPRTALLQWWLIVCLYGSVWGGGSIHAWLMGVFAIITVLEPYSPGAHTEPMSLYHRLAHIPTILPALVCGMAIHGAMQNQPTYSALCGLSGSLLLGCILARAAGTLRRFRTAYLMQSIVCSGFTSVLMAVRYSRMAAVAGSRWVSITLLMAVGALVGSLSLLGNRRLTGSFNPERFWEN
jgi:hypothetical protein